VSACHASKLSRQQLCLSLCASVRIQSSFMTPRSSFLSPTAKSGLLAGSSRPLSRPPGPTLLSRCSSVSFWVPGGFHRALWLPWVLDIGFNKSIMGSGSNFEVESYLFCFPLSQNLVILTPSRELWDWRALRTRLLRVYCFTNCHKGPGHAQLTLSGHL